MDPQAVWPSPAAPPQLIVTPPVTRVKGRRSPGRVAAAAAVLLAAVGACAGAVAESGLSPARAVRPGSGADAAQIATAALWRAEPADVILPRTVHREGTEDYFRLAVDPDQGCARLPQQFRSALGQAGCAHVLEATYLDSTESVVVTLGVVVTGGTAAERAALARSWTPSDYARQYAMMPFAFPVPASQASTFRDAERIAWESAASDDGVYLTFAVAGFADGRPGPSQAAFDHGKESELQPDSPPEQAAEDLAGYLLTSITALAPRSSGAGS